MIEFFYSFRIILFFNDSPYGLQVENLVLKSKILLPDSGCYWLEARLKCIVLLVLHLFERIIAFLMKH